MNNTRTRRLTLKLATLLALTASLSFASSITFYTPTGSNDAAGDPISASATFVTGLHTLTITLTNLQTPMHAVGQLLGDLEFTFGPGVTGSTTMTSSSAQEITVNSNGSSTLGSTVSTGWGFGTNLGEFILCVICPASATVTGKTAGPDDTIIGPGPYTGTNSGIKGNGPHNPFINQTATFSLFNSSITAATTITSASFSFGTEAGNEVVGCSGASNNCGGVVTGQAVPEPVGMLLMGTGLLGIALIKIRRK